MKPAPLNPGTRPSRAFISGMVVGSLFLVGIAILSLSYYFATQARRTRDTVHGAQLRQLLLAAPAFVQADLASRGFPDQPRQLAATVPSEAGTLSIAFAKDNTPDQVLATATAVFKEKTAVQRLSYRQVAGQWQLTDTQLVQTP